MRNQQERERLAELNRRKLLAAESAALLLLLRRRNSVVAAGLRAEATARTIASGLSAAWRPAIAQARTFSRSLGVASVRRELVSLGVHDAPAGRLAEEAIRDIVRARIIADSYAKRWEKAAEASGIETASAATLGSVERIAATESAEAFNAGRLRAVRGYSFMRVWDAQLDRRTCPVCESTDGTIVGASEPFPIGEPGAVHPNCRCTWQIITLEESK